MHKLSYSASRAHWCQQIQLCEVHGMESVLKPLLMGGLSTGPSQIPENSRKSNWQGQGQVVTMDPMLGWIWILPRIVKVSEGCYHMITEQWPILLLSLCMPSVLKPVTWKCMSYNVHMQDQVETYCCSDTGRLTLLQLSLPIPWLLRHCWSLMSLMCHV